VLVNALRDEVESSSAFHLNGPARVMRQDKNGNVIGWVVTPPTLPAQVRPRTANRSEHVPPENPGTDVLETACREVVVDTGRAIATAMGPLKGARRNKPLLQVHPAAADAAVDV